MTICHVDAYHSPQRWVVAVTQSRSTTSLMDASLDRGADLVVEPVRMPLPWLTQELNYISLCVPGPGL